MKTSFLLCCLLLQPGYAAMRIMPMGDSLTFGHTVKGGYRLYLYEDLKKAGTDFDFVGRLKPQPEDPTPDPDFFAAGGVTISHHTQVVDGKSYVLLAPYKKDYWGLLDRLPQAITAENFSKSPAERNVVLLMIGVNDFLKKVCGTHYGAVTDSGQPEDKLEESAWERLLVLLTTMDKLAGEQGVKLEVFVGTSTEFKSSGSAVVQQEMKDYNKKILTALPSEYGHLKVKGVDSAASFSNDLLDGLHPNPEGCRKLGAFWAGTILGPRHGG